MKQSVGLFQKYLALDATVPVQNFNEKIRKEMYRILNDYRDRQYIAETDALTKCLNLMQQFEKSAFHVSLQLNRSFWMYCNLKKLESEKQNTASKSVYSSLQQAICLNPAL